MGDEIDESLLERMSDGLKQRDQRRAHPLCVRPGYAPWTCWTVLIGKLKISNFDAVIPGGRYHNFKDFMSFPRVGPKYLLNKKLRALDCQDFDKYASPFDAIKKRDILVHYPYYKFRYMTELVRYAACRPESQTDQA